METVVDTDRATVRLIKSDKELYAALEEMVKHDDPYRLWDQTE